MLGEKLRILRKQAGMTQTKLAHDLGLSTSTIGMYEQGRRLPNEKVAIQISEYFRVSLDWLYKDDLVLKAEDLTDELERKLLEPSVITFEGEELDKEDVPIILKAFREGLHAAYQRKIEDDSKKD